ncbi:CU044_5270 family protein [Thermomonospora cellulosilytica]|uniref:CU044_5270 family protein n=1 Tax=Thermomonospora cellulosilytica TaxID=1411118 RepID=A0A7W3MV65_9ACTN|nr:CU044_5270 family protein [Thermomonospora cellulosilytica]MBA9002448.1 hypothetical protein [Thermomonospora cellulosilytica]
MSDVMRRLAEARPDHLDPETPVDPAVREAELTRAMAAPRRSRARRRLRVRPMWGLGLVSAATAAAVAFPVIAGPGGTEPGGADPVRRPGAGTTQTVVNARTVLLAAADGARRQPERSGRYWHTRTRYGVLEQVGPAGNRYAVLHQYQHDVWTPRAVDDEGWFRAEDLGAKPATPADEAAWRKDGRPTSWSTAPVPKGGGRDTAASLARDLEMHPKDSAFAHATGRPSDAPDDLNITQRELDRTPADPARLRALLLSHPLGEADDGDNTDAELFETAAGILMSRPLSPDKRAAFYRMLADIKGVTAVDGVKDATGRPGTALKMRQTGREGAYEIHFVVDRTTGAGLAKEIRYLEPKAGKSWLKPGTRWYYEAVTSQWVDTLPEMPRPPRG